LSKEHMDQHDLEAGEKLYKAGEYHEAYKVFKQLAKRKNIDGMYWLGRYYYEQAKSFRKAERWWNKSGTRKSLEYLISHYERLKDVSNPGVTFVQN